MHFVAFFCDLPHFFAINRAKRPKRAQKRDRDRANEMRRSRRGHIIILYTQHVPTKIQRREGKWQKNAVLNGYGALFCEKMKKNLHMSQKSANFVRFLVRRAAKAEKSTRNTRKTRTTRTTRYKTKKTQIYGRQ